MKYKMIVFLVGFTLTAGLQASGLMRLPASSFDGEVEEGFATPGGALTASPGYSSVGMTPADSATPATNVGLSEIPCVFEPVPFTYTILSEDFSLEKDLNAEEANYYYWLNGYLSVFTNLSKTFDGRMDALKAKGSEYIQAWLASTEDDSPDALRVVWQNKLASGLTQKLINSLCDNKDLLDNNVYAAFSIIALWFTCNKIEHEHSWIVRFMQPTELKKTLHKRLGRSRARSC